MLGFASLVERIDRFGRIPGPERRATAALKNE